MEMKMKTNILSNSSKFCTPMKKKKNFSPTSFYFSTRRLVSWAYVKFFAQICEATGIIIFEIRPARQREERSFSEVGEKFFFFLGVQNLLELDNKSENGNEK
jgi:hypothetical protein